MVLGSVSRPLILYSKQICLTCLNKLVVLKWLLAGTIPIPVLGVGYLVWT